MHVLEIVGGPLSAKQMMLMRYSVSNHGVDKNAPLRIDQECEPPLLITSSSSKVSYVIPLRLRPCRLNRHQQRLRTVTQPSWVTVGRPSASASAMIGTDAVGGA